MRRCDSATLRSSQKTAMNQVGFDDIFERSLVLPYRRREGIEAHWAAAKLLYESRQERTIETIKAGVIDIEPFERELRRIHPNSVRVAIAPRCKVAHAAE